MTSKHKIIYLAIVPIYEPKVKRKLKLQDLTEDRNNMHLKNTLLLLVGTLKSYQTHDH
jgi:hypothetical protein